MNIHVNNDIVDTTVPKLITNKEYKDYYIIDELDTRRLITKDDIYYFVVHIEKVLKEMKNRNRRLALTNIFFNKSAFFAEIFIENRDMLCNFIKNLINVKYIDRYRGYGIGSSVLRPILFSKLHMLQKLIDNIEYTIQCLGYDKMKDGKLIIQKRCIEVTRRGRYIVNIYGLHRLIDNSIYCTPTELIKSNDTNEYRISEKNTVYYLKRIYLFFGYSLEDRILKHQLIKFLNDNIIYE